MPLTDVRNLGQLGLITDVAPHEIPPRAWSNSLNVAFRGTEVEVVYGAQEVFGTPNFTPLFLGAARGANGLYWVYTDGAEVNACLASTHYDINGAAAFSGNEDDKWDFEWLNGVLFMNNGLDAPHSWVVDHGSNIASLANWPSGYTCGALRKFKNFLVALDVTKSSTRYPTLVKWSHPADPGAVPESWDETDPDYLAGEQPLSNTAGFLYDGLPLGDQFVIYKSDSIVLMQFVGGQSVFRFIDIPGGVGILAKKCVAQVDKGLHAFISSAGKPYLFDGQMLMPIAETVIEDDFQYDATQEYRSRSFVVFDPQEKEIWFVLPGETPLPYKVYVYDMRYKTWHVREITPTLSADVGIFSPELGPAWADDTDIWSDDDSIWDSGRAGAATQRNLVFAHNELDKFYQWNVGDSIAGTAYDVTLERTGLAIYGNQADGDVKVDFSKVKLVTEIWPLVEVVEDELVTITIGVQDKKNEPVVWADPVDFNPWTEEKIDVLVEGKFVAIRFEVASTSRMKLQGYKLMVGDVGKYF